MPSVAPLPFGMLEDSGMLWIDWRPTFLALADPAAARARAPQWASALHAAVAQAAVAMVTFAFSKTGTRTVALSGGVFMNQILTEAVTRLLTDCGARVCLHRQTPPGDGGIALGQAVRGGC